MLTKLTLRFFVLELCRTLLLSNSHTNLLMTQKTGYPKIEISEDSEKIENLLDRKNQLPTE